MIYTVTFNPAIDYIMRLGTLKAGEVNRSSSEEIYIGGKGINVSFILNELDISSAALGFTAGFTGEAIEKGVEDAGIKADFVKLKNGSSRINVKIKSEKETEINGQGPKIPKEAIDELFSKLDALKEDDILILAGSIPNTLPEDMYEKILERLSDRGVKFVVDATKDLLVNVLKYKPFLIKPNNHELGEIFNVTLSDENQIIEYARKLREMGALNVLVSMAGDGSILIDENDNVHIMGVAKGEVKNSVGAGDSMVAGFVAGYIKTGDYNYAIKLGTASGGATAFSPGLAKKDDIIKVFKTL